MAGFREPEQPKHEGVLFAHRLDDALPEDHAVRHVDAILQSEPFTLALKKLVKSYHLREGRPPYHPRYMVGLYLYGMLSRLRSSRQLESACHNRIDFIWLMDGQKPDHSTIAGFVTRHRKAIQRLFRQLLEVGVSAGLVKLRNVAIDGTLIQANAATGSVKSREEIQSLIAKIDETIKSIDADWEAQEAADQAVFGSDSDDLTPPRADDDKSRRAALEAKKQQLKEALEVIGRRVEESSNPKQTKPRTSTTDPESRKTKGKDGRIGPHFNAQVAVDVDSGMVVADEVVDRAEDSGLLTPMIERTIANCGRQPDSAVADSAYNTGIELERAAAMGLDVYVPDAGPSKAGLNAEQAAIKEKIARGEALSQDEIDALPLDHNKRLNKSVFVYDEELDSYRCPMSATLTYFKTVKNKQRKVVANRREYGGASECAECPLASRCYSSQKKARIVTRDQYEPLREECRDRMKGARGEQLYAERGPAAERPFGEVKGNRGITRFLRRGLANVSFEWSLIVAALNLRTLLANWDSVSKTLEVV